VNPIAGAGATASKSVNPVAVPSGLANSEKKRQAAEKLQNQKNITYTPTWSPNSFLPLELAERFKIRLTDKKNSRKR